MNEKKSAAQAAILDAITALAPNVAAPQLRDLAEAYSYVNGRDAAAPRKGAVVA